MIECVLKTVRILPALDFNSVLYCDPYSREEVYQDYFKTYNLPIRMQQGNDLGERLLHCLTTFLEDERSAIVIGSDCVELTASLLTEAKEALESSDLVLGPALDGGYYLIGMKKPRQELFVDIPWSTVEVLSRTLSHAQKSGLRTHLLEPLRDIDTKADLHRFGVAP